MSSRDSHNSSSDDKLSHPRSRSPQSQQQQPSLMEEEEGNSQEHPLLSLHQSVGNNSNRKGNGSRGETKNENQLQKQSTRKSNNEKQVLDESNNITVTLKANSSNKMTSDQPKPDEMKGEEQKEKQHKKNKKPLAAMLVKTVAIIILLILWLSLTNSVMINSSIEKSALPKIITDLSAGITIAQLGVVSVVQDWSKQILSLLPVLDTKKDSRLDQFEKRLEVGQNLLRKYEDASGSAAACEGALHSIVENVPTGGSDGKRKDLLSMVSSSMTVLNADENRLLSKALLCLGEARLALFSSSFGSQAMKRVQLMEAKESFEAATAVDPTNPSVRSGFGLSYLLLGVAKYDGVMDNSIQFIFQSIQHLKAAVGLTNDDDMERTDNDDEIATVRTAAMHNLGLAYISLDGMSSSSEASGGVKNTHFLDWVTALRSSETSPSVMESWVYLANEGALLLQMGKMEDAISSLESTARDVCTDSLSSSRQKETCLIVQQNLAVAKEALFGEHEEPSTQRQLGDRATIHDEVARWNGDASSAISTVVSDPEPNEHMNVTLPSDDGVAETIDVGEEKNETSSAIEEIDESNDAASGAETKTEPTDILVDEKVSPDVEPTKKEEAIIEIPQTPMQNALAALEKAAKEGPQRTRLLLALARARSSAGDLSGAVDVALKAITAATSDEESETSTSYLEMLMEKMAGEGNENTIPIIPEEEHVLEKVVEKTSNFVESKDFALSELSLKLELERLKYKILEQEMMLGRHRNSANYEGEMRAIDYRQEVGNIVHDTPRRQQNSDVEENIVKRKTMKMPIEHETTVDVIQQETAVVEDVEETSVVEDVEETAIVEDVEETAVVEDVEETVVVEDVEETAAVEDVEESKPVVLKNETDNAISDDSAGSETLSESQNADTESLLTTDDAESDENQTTAAEIEDPIEEVIAVEPIQLPSLYEPTLKPPTAISPTAKSYMKMADAYLDKGNYALAAKQFLKVIKKAPDHLPAHLGYATCVERSGKSKQINTAALAYGNATKVAIIQGERVDPMAKAGSGGIAENIMRRAVQLAKSAPSGRSETLQLLSTYAHTSALAADLHFEIGMEISKQGIDQGDNKDEAMKAFSIANEFVATRNDTESPYHIGSIVELGKIALEYERNGNKIIENFNKVKNVHMEDDLHVELLVLVGRAHVSLGDLETAITEFTRALSFPQRTSTPSAHHELAIALKKNNGDTHEINLHFEKALDMGMDPTSEAIEALGERNRSMMRALNRQYYKNSNSGSAERTGGGGIMSGGGVGSQSASVFAPQAKQNEEAPAQSDTLSLLEQGAATYDGHTPVGGEVEGTESSLSNLKVKKQRGSESNLSNLRR